jgi:hypothetical protein
VSGNDSDSDCYIGVRRNDQYKTVRSKKKIRVGADQTFQLAIRVISINRCQS